MNIHAPLYSHFINGRRGPTGDASETIFKRDGLRFGDVETGSGFDVGPKIYRHFNVCCDGLSLLVIYTREIMRHVFRSLYIRAEICHFFYFN